MHVENASIENLNLTLQVAENESYLTSAANLKIA